MATFEYDLGYIQEAMNILESYLLAKDVFWNFPVSPPPGEAPYPALTLGGILLSAALISAREEGRSLQPAQVAVWHELSSRLETLRRRWQSAWNQKAERSFNARLTQWGNFLEEYRENPKEHAPRYTYEVRLRVMLDLLAQDISPLSSHYQDYQRSLDVILGHSLQAGAFIWADAIAAGFAPDRYWYLYGQLLSERTAHT